MTRRLAGLLLAGLLLLAGCSGSGDDSDNEAPSAAEDASTLKSAIPSITKTVEITEDNDPNEDIGRPGKYSQAFSIYDSRSECESELDVTCGAKIEVFDSEADAKARSEYVLDTLKAMQMLGSEYHYIDGPTLLRVSGSIKPSEAKAYKAAFTN